MNTTIKFFASLLTFIFLTTVVQAQIPRNRTCKGHANATTQQNNTTNPRKAEYDRMIANKNVNPRKAEYDRMIANQKKNVNPRKVEYDRMAVKQRQLDRLEAKKKIDQAVKDREKKAEIVNDCGNGGDEDWYQN